MISRYTVMFLDWFKHVKSSLKFVLFVIFCFGVYAVVRSESFGENVLGLQWFIALPLAFAIETFIVAGTAVSINARLTEHSKKMKGEDGSQARKTVRLARASIWGGFIALLSVAFFDGMAEHGSVWIGLITSSIQLVQMIFIVAYTELEFIDKSDTLSATLKAKKRRTERFIPVKQCPCCGRDITINNFKRHTASCQ